MTLRAVAQSGSGATLKTNGVLNSTQTLLNLAQGGGVTISEAAGTVTVASTNADATLLFADAPNTDFDLTNGGAGGAVTILSKTITGILAEDQIEFDLFYTILNNSTAARTYTPAFSIGTLSVTAAEIGTIANNATNRAIRNQRISFAISANNLGYAIVSSPGTAGVAANTGAAAANQGGSMWNTSTNDNTGNQTFTFTVSSSATTATQTLTLHSYTIRKISKI